MTNAAFWIATSNYMREVVPSARSVERQMPADLHRILFSDGGNHDVFHNRFAITRQHSLWYLDFVQMMNEAIQTLDYDRLLYLDTDTFVAHPVPEIFDLLDYFDLLSVHAPARRISYTTRYIPDCFPEFNTGVLAFRNNAQVRELFANWLKMYQANPDLYGENDQAPLRECLLEWPGRFWAMPTEYNCRFGFGGQARGLIKILHGRSDDMASLAEQINSSIEIRGWRRGDFK